MRLEAVRAAYGLCQLAVPNLLARRVGVQLDSRSRPLARVLGARHVAQAAATAALGRHRPGVHRLGASVDLAHAASMLALAAVDRRRRRAALIEVLGASLFATGELLTRPAVRVDPGEEVRQEREDFARGAPKVDEHGRLVRARSRESLRVQLGGVFRTSGAGNPLDGTRQSIPGPTEETDQQLAQRDEARDRQLAIQEVVARSKGRPAGEIKEDLEAVLLARGLVRQPRAWLEAVASDAALGHLYVVSDEALHDAGIVIDRPDPGRLTYHVD